MKNQIWKKMSGMLAVLASCTLLLAGCSDERMEDELAYRQVGIKCMEKGDYEGAVAAFESALDRHLGGITETELDICFYKAAAQFASGDIESALATYDAILAYDEKNANAYYLRGTLYLQQGNGEGALSDYANAVKYNASDYELYVNIYETLSAYNLAEQGEEYLNKAFDIKGASAEQLTWRGRIYYLLGQYDNAAEELLAAVEKESVTANLYLAQTYEAQGNSEQAAVYYQAYVDAGVADSVAFNALGEIELEKGNYAAALAYFQQGLALEEVTNRKALMQNEIVAYEYTGDFTSAWEVVQEYIVLYPEDAAAQREYIFLENRQGTVETNETEEPTEASTESETEEPTGASTENGAQ